MIRHRDIAGTVNLDNARPFDNPGDHVTSSRTAIIATATSTYPRAARSSPASFGYDHATYSVYDPGRQIPFGIRGTF